MSLDDRLDAIFAARNRDDMAPTIAALLPILEQHPDNPRVLYEVGGAYDTAGHGNTMLPLAELFDMDKSVVSRQVRILEEDGLVMSRPDERDGRVRVLEPTAFAIERELCILVE